jgi:hypothetical protein
MELKYDRETSSHNVIASVKSDDESWEMCISASGIPIQRKSPLYQGFVQEIAKASRRTIEDYLRVFDLPDFSNWDELGKVRQVNTRRVDAAQVVHVSIREKVDFERDAFLRMLPQLRLTHYGEYVAVENGRLVASAKKSRALIRRLAEIDPVGRRFFYVAEVSDSASEPRSDVSLSSYP